MKIRKNLNKRDFKVFCVCLLCEMYLELVFESLVFARAQIAKLYYSVLYVRDRV